MPPSQAEPTALPMVTKYIRRYPLLFTILNPIPARSVALAAFPIGTQGIRKSPCHRPHINHIPAPGTITKALLQIMKDIKPKNRHHSIMISIRRPLAIPVTLFKVIMEIWKHLYHLLITSSIRALGINSYFRDIKLRRVVERGVRLTVLENRKALPMCMGNHFMVSWNVCTKWELLPL